MARPRTKITNEGENGKSRTEKIRAPQSGLEHILLGAALLRQEGKLAAATVLDAVAARLAVGAEPDDPRTLQWARRAVRERGVDVADAGQLERLRRLVATIEHSKFKRSDDSRVIATYAFAFALNVGIISVVPADHVQRLIFAANDLDKLQRRDAESIAAKVLERFDFVDARRAINDALKRS